jgi:hypothetical protein
MPDRGLLNYKIINDLFFESILNLIIIYNIKN